MTKEQFFALWPERIDPARRVYLLDRLAQASENAPYLCPSRGEDDPHNLLSMMGAMGLRSRSIESEALLRLAEISPELLSYTDVAALFGGSRLALRREWIFHITQGPQQ